MITFGSFIILSICGNLSSILRTPQSDSLLSNIIVDYIPDVSQIRIIIRHISLNEDCDILMVFVQTQIPLKMIVSSVYIYFHTLNLDV